MYTDTRQWSKIRRQVLYDGVSRRQIVRETGISRQTVRKMLLHPTPLPYGGSRDRNPEVGPHIALMRRLLDENARLPPSSRRSVKAVYDDLCQREKSRGNYKAALAYARATESGKRCIWGLAYDLVRALDKQRAVDFLFLLSRDNVRVLSADRTAAFFRDVDRVLTVAPKPRPFETVATEAFQWMRALLQKEMSADQLRRELGEIPDLDFLLDRIYEGRIADRNRSIAVLASKRRIRTSTISAFLNISKPSVHKYLQLFNRGGVALLFERRMNKNNKSADEPTKNAVFSVLHEPPSNYGINRTTWKMADLSRVLGEKGRPACEHVIRRIVKAAGYKWRKARIVLTSKDPSFSEKLGRIRSILSRLRPDEAFFSIDEFGPFSIKMKPGLALNPPGKNRVVPQWQKSRGCLVMTGALELSGNQVAHFFSIKKDTTEMIKMMELLVHRYHDRRKIYLSWDAASWHISKRLFERIDQHNTMVKATGPIVETAPLPAGAQFLNVIESVFSGMARAIIHNSDYQTVDDAKAAINRYFHERNDHFQAHPRRAGKSIWGKEREPSTFSASNNCKDPKYR